MNRAIRRVGGAVVVLILVLVAQLTYLQIIDADNLENDPLNVRSALRDANRPRGEIRTADGVVLARSVPVDDGTEFKFQREYPEGALFSQIVGYQSFVVGNTGVEKTYNDQLVGRDTELQIENIPDIVGGDEVGGQRRAVGARRRAAHDAGRALRRAGPGLGRRARRAQRQGARHVLEPVATTRSRSRATT